jgi:hypothetical protein
MTQVPINEKLEAIFVESYFHSGKLINGCISAFFRFSNGCWYKIVLSDGESIIELVGEPNLNSKDSNEEFYYPVSAYKEIDLANFGYLVKICEFFWLGKRDECCGFSFQFDNGRCLYVVEIDDEIVLSEKSDVIRKEWREEERIL